MWVFVCKLFWVCTRAVAMATAGKKQWRRAMREVVWWRWWGVEAIIGEGWRGHVLCTFSLLSCSSNIVRLLCWVLITQPLVHSVCKFKILSTWNHMHTHKHTPYNVPSTLKCISNLYFKEKDRIYDSSLIRVVHLSDFSQLWCSYLLPHLPPSSPPSLLRASSGCHGNGPPMGDRDQIITDQGIQKLKDMIFLSPPSPPSPPSLESKPLKPKQQRPHQNFDWELFMIRKKRSEPNLTWRAKWTVWDVNMLPGGTRTGERTRELKDLTDRERRSAPSGNPNVLSFYLR